MLACTSSLCCSVLSTSLARTPSCRLALRRETFLTQPHDPPTIAVTTSHTCASTGPPDPDSYPPGAKPPTIPVRSTGSDRPSSVQARHHREGECCGPPKHPDIEQPSRQGGKANILYRWPWNPGPHLIPLLRLVLPFRTHTEPSHPSPPSSH
ncbi:unnamed protein product [Ectocarpus sp. 12 AP-2014]